jgi:hypothetical protein
MPAALTPIPVPKFSKLHIIHAELCAQDLWNGIDYETGKRKKYSDEEYLILFNPINQPVLNPNQVQILKKVIHTFIVDAKMKALYRSTKPMDLNQALASFTSTAGTVYAGYKSGALVLPKIYQYGTIAALDWGTQFVVKQPGSNATNGNRIPLSNRILFYAMPGLKIYNLSNPLTKKMRLQSRPQAALPNFNKIMYEGQLLNHLHLSALKPPKSTAISDEIWTSKVRKDWWERRVLDLAMLIHHQVATPRSELYQQARLIFQQTILKKAVVKAIKTAKKKN